MDEPMADETRKGAGWWAVLLAVLLLPALYFLSAGPARFIVARTGRGMDTVLVVYAPIIWLDRNTRLKKPTRWYADLGTFCPRQAAGTAPPRQRGRTVATRPLRAINCPCRARKASATGRSGAA